MVSSEIYALDVSQPGLAALNLAILQCGIRGKLSGIWRKLKLQCCLTRFLDCYSSVVANVQHGGRRSYNLLDPTPELCVLLTEDLGTLDRCRSIKSNGDRVIAIAVHKHLISSAVSSLTDSLAVCTRSFARDVTRPKRVTPLDGYL